MFFLERIPLQELIVEVIEGGCAGFIESLSDFEPIPIEILLEEAGRRLGSNFSSSKDFLDFVLAPSSSFVDEHTKVVLMHAVRVKEIEKKMVGGRNDNGAHNSPDEKQGSE